MSPTSETAKGGRRLVIVESPAKAKTIKGYLGPGYVVEASVGPIRDLPNGAAEVPEKYTGEVRRLHARELEDILAGKPLRDESAP